MATNKNDGHPALVAEVQALRDKVEMLEQRAKRLDLLYTNLAYTSGVYGRENAWEMIYDAVEGARRGENLWDRGGATW